MDLGPIENIVHGLMPHDWHGKHDGAAVTSVEKVDCGLNLANQKFWLKTRFTEAGAPHTLMAKMGASGAGQKGGSDEITLDDQPVEGDDCVFGLQFKLFPPGAKIVIAYKYKADGKDHRYEFQGAVPLPLLGI
jgi:hypothetical protein